MAPQYSADDVREMAESGICEPSRLLHIRGMIEAGRPLYNSDRAYLDRVASRLAGKEAALRQENRRIRRVLGAGPGAVGAAARAGPRPAAAPAAEPAARAGPRPAAAPAAEPAVIDDGAAHAAEQAAAHEAAQAPPSQPGRPLQSPSAAAPAGTVPARGQSPASPAPAPAPGTPLLAQAHESRHTLIDDASFDAILERRDRRRHAEARERAAEAAVGSPSTEPRVARQASSPDGRPAPTIAGRLRGIVAGRR